MNDVSKLIQQKFQSKGRTRNLLKKLDLTQEDVGKYFYTSTPNEHRGHLVTWEQFQKVPPTSIIAWVQVTQHDVSVHEEQ